MVIALDAKCQAESFLRKLWDFWQKYAIIGEFPGSRTWFSTQDAVPLRVLLTAFEPYDDWSDNSSWLALVELLKDRPRSVELVTRRYPSRLSEAQGPLRKDLMQSFDAILHLGQLPGITSVRLEAIAANVVGKTDEIGKELPTLVDSGPLAYRTTLPVGHWADLLRGAGIPAEVSYHAGTHLCNALFYLTQHTLQMHDQATPVCFVHLPLTTSQAVRSKRALPSLSVEALALALRLMVDSLPDALKRKSDLARTASS